MTCVNCSASAKHVFQAPGVKDQPYCDAHLPAAYRNTEWVLPAPDEVLQVSNDFAADEPLAEVKELGEDKPESEAVEAEEKPVEDPNPELKPEPKRRGRRSPGER